jgi:Domain of Unknown Function (DUF1080)
LTIIWAAQAWFKAGMLIREARKMKKCLPTLRLIYFGLLCVTLTAAAQSASKAILGRWDLTITAPAGELPSWIEVSEVEGAPKIVMVGVTDHATLLKTFNVHGTQLEFVSPKGEEGFPSDMSFKGKLTGHELVGTVTDPAGTVWTWKGVPAPALKRKAPTKWGKPVTLFNGKDLTGWVPRSQSKEASWKAEDGTLVKDGNGPDLVNTSKFQDFKLHIEFNCGVNANSGVFLRGRYEVQVETESAAEPNSHHTGGVYGFLDPTPEQPRKADVWQTFDITLVGRYVTVVQNGITVIDNKEIPGITGGALDSHEGMPGPIYLQASEVGRVAYRNIVITPAIE